MKLSEFVPLRKIIPNHTMQQVHEPRSGRLDSRSPLIGGRLQRQARHIVDQPGHQRIDRALNVFGVLLHEVQKRRQAEGLEGILRRHADTLHPDQQTAKPALRGHWTVVSSVGLP